MPNHLVHASALLLGLAAGGLSLFAGCSGNDPGPDSGDGGTSGTASSSGNPTSSSGTSASNGGTTSSGASGTSGTSGTTSGGQTNAQCIAACEAQYPKGVALGDGIDQCWAKSCTDPCNGLAGGVQFPPAHGSCMNLVETPGAACSQCTVDHCCSAWDACFNNTDCTALNKCSIACYK